MPTFYRVPRPQPKHAPLARLYVTMVAKGTRFYERPSVDSPLVGHVYGRTLFHGAPLMSGRWVSRLASEGGGYAWSGVVAEVL